MTRADLHIHTNFSFDGKSSPQEIVDKALENNINCICITDHGEIKGAITALKYAFDKEILVIPGIEIETEVGDILGINVKKTIPNGLSLKETVKEIQKQKGLAIIAHPFHLPMLSFKGKGEDFLLVDGIEVFNASLFNFFNQKAFHLLKEYDLCFTAGSDAHCGEFVGRAYLEFSQDNLTTEKVIEEIRKKRGKIGGENLNFREMLKDNLRKKAFYCCYHLISKNGKKLKKIIR